PPLDELGDGPAHALPNAALRRRGLRLEHRLDHDHGGVTKAVGGIGVPGPRVDLRACARRRHCVRRCGPFGDEMRGALGIEQFGGGMHRRLSVFHSLVYRNTGTEADTTTNSPGIRNPWPWRQAPIDSTYRSETRARTRSSKRDHASAIGPPTKTAPQASSASAYSIVVATRYSSMPSNRASAHRRASVSPFPSPKNSGHTSLATSASTIGNTVDQPQRTRSPHTAMTARPPGR